MSDRPPFRNASDALRYLFNPERASCDRPPAARLADKRRGEPGALSGMDGAATAAVAEKMLRGRLTRLQLAVLSCRYAPKKLRCECRSDCCSGWRTNPAWREAVTFVAGEAVYQVLPRHEAIDSRYITAVLLREYGKVKISLTDVGTDIGMSLGTCTARRRQILEWLLHRPDAHKDEADQPAHPRGQELAAYGAAEEVLRSGGFIE